MANLQQMHQAGAQIAPSSTRLFSIFPHRSIPGSTGAGLTPHTSLPLPRTRTWAVTADHSPASQPTASTSSDFAFDLVCPICQTTPLRVRSVAGRPSGSLACARCSRTFSQNDTYVDLTVSSGVEQDVYKQQSWGGTELFRSPLISFAYERGWRAGFAWAGFPGVDQEFETAMRYLEPGRGQVGLLGGVHAVAAVHRMGGMVGEEVTGRGRRAGSVP
jgi:hypothetical protein